MILTPKLERHSRTENKKSALYKRRFLGRIGQKCFMVLVENIRYFEADGKVVFANDINGARYVIDYSLEQLESQLDPFCFFRLNRKYLMCSEAIQYAKPFPNNRLKLCIKGLPDSSDFIVSRSRVSAFKAWVES